MVAVSELQKGAVMRSRRAGRRWREALAVDDLGLGLMRAILSSDVW
jgi:hypothetical protein